MRAQAVTRRIGVLAILALVAVGCVPANRVGGVPTAATSSALTTSEVVALLAVPGSYAGDGNGVLSAHIEAGTWTFRVSHDGPSRFSAVLRNPSGERMDTLEQEKGAAPVLRSIKIKRAGIYRLEVSAEGHWSIKVEGCTCSAESQ